MPDALVQPRTGASPKRSIFFHPSRRSSSHLLEQLRRYAGWDLARTPETANCVLYQDTTWVTLPEDDWA